MVQPAFIIGTNNEDGSDNFAPVCLYHQKKDFISVPYEPKDAEYGIKY